MSEKSSASCPKCGTPLLANAPAGLCPRCVMAMNLATQTEFTGDEPSPQSSAPKPPPPTPAELAARFPQLEILELLGRGGMGAVYKARQKELDRIVAIKILPPGVGDDPAFAERFTREAKALAKLNHPGIVTIYDFGKADGLFYFLMEFVDGVNLRQLLATGRVSSREALAIVPQICDALQYAHDHGIVHRDIKPENILMDRRGNVKVADFGLAKLVGGNEAQPRAGADQQVGSTNLTEAGKVMGTPQYMAPEQAEHPGEVDHRADIYALGVVFYQMLTGELPGKRIEPPSKKVLVDVRLDEIVLRALEKEPELRFQQASQFKTQVETIAHSGTPGTKKTLLQKPVVGRRGDKATVNWPTTLALSIIVLFVVEAVDVVGSLLWIGRVDARTCFIGLGVSTGIIAGMIIGKLIQPLEKLTPLDEPPASPKTSPGAPSIYSRNWVRGILWAVFVGCLLNFLLPHSAFIGANHEPTITIGGTQPWTGSYPKILEDGARTRITFFNPASSAFRCGIVALIAGILLLLGRRAVDTPPQKPIVDSGINFCGKRFLPRLGALAVAAIFLTEVAIQITGHWRESDQERWFIPFLILSAAGGVWAVWPVFRAPQSLRKSICAVLGFFVAVVLLYAASEFYGNKIVPAFLHPELRAEMQKSFGSSPSAVVPSSDNGQFNDTSNATTQLPESAGDGTLVGNRTNAAASKRQQFIPKEGTQKETSWGVLPNPSDFNRKGWALMARMTLGGVAHVQLPDEKDNLCRMKMIKGNDDQITLEIEDLREKNSLAVTLGRDQPAEILINGKGYRVLYPSTYVAPKDPDTSPIALVVLTEMPPANPGGAANSIAPDRRHEQRDNK